MSFVACPVKASPQLAKGAAAQSLRARAAVRAAPMKVGGSCTPPQWGLATRGKALHAPHAAFLAAAPRPAEGVDAPLVISLQVT